MATLAARITALAEAIRDKINTMMPRLVPGGGTTGQALVKTSDTDHALGWASAGGGWQQIGSTINTTSGASVSFTSIPSTYSDLLLVFEGVSHNSGSNQNLLTELSDDGSNWTNAVLIASGLPPARGWYSSMLILNYRGPAGSTLQGDQTADTSADRTAAVASGRSVGWRLAGGIAAIRFSPAAGSFDAGTIKLFGRA